MTKPYTIILGSTGSVGLNAIDVIRKHNKGANKVQIIGLANATKKLEQEKLKDEFGAIAAISLNGDYERLESIIEKLVSEYGSENINALNAISGFDGLRASILLAKYKIETLLANKESIVAGGRVYLNYAKENKVNIIPIDSEHSAIYTLRKAHKKIKKVIITASGGPFKDRERLDYITPQQAARHPNWNMGPKISIDSATLANKVLEVIEAKYLFGLSKNKIDVVINPQSLVHSMVVLKNNAIYAEISSPDMKLPISKAYGFTDESFINTLDFTNLHIDFQKPDTSKFKFLSLVDELLSSDAKCIIFNAANEYAVDEFRKNKIKFTQIYDVVKYALDSSKEFCPYEQIKDFNQIYTLDKNTRDFLSSSAGY